MPESMTAYWNGAHRSSFPAGISGRKRRRLPKHQQRGLYPKSETEKKVTGQFPHRQRWDVRERSISPMSNEKMNQNTTPAAEDVPALVKKIGRTTYIVKIHFSETNKETMSDKIKRMLRNEIQQM